MSAAIFNLGALVGDKPVWKSMTAWGLALFAAVPPALDVLCAEGTGVLSTETCAMLTTWAQNVGGVLTVLGLRRAATAPNVG